MDFEGPKALAKKICIRGFMSRSLRKWFDSPRFPREKWTAQHEILEA